MSAEQIYLGGLLLPEGAEHVVTFTTWGVAKPAGSKTTGVSFRKDKASGQMVPARRGDGRIITFTKDDSGPAGKTWRADIRDAVKDEMGKDGGWELLDGPLVIITRYYFERPASHYGTGKNAKVLKTSAPRFPHRRQTGDGTKLLRAVEDALNAFLVKDDKRFVRGLWIVDFGRSRSEVSIWRLPELVGAGLDALELQLSV